MMDLMETARKIRDEEDPALLVWVTLQMMNWEALEKKIGTHAQLVSCQLQEPDIVYQVVLFLAVAMGKMDVPAEEVNAD